MAINISISEKYKEAQKKSIFWIVIFLITFIFSLLLSIVLFIGSLFLAFYILSIKLSLWTIIGAIGVAITGGLIVFFNFKYFFSIFKKTQENGTQIYPKDYPELFDLIYKTADEIGTKHPKKVFLIEDINASVYYSSQIQSLFLPTAKNLNIGVGIMQLLTVNELKAVLAHEFGHFSQKSMVIGSYTNNAYRVLHEIVNNKESMIDFINYINEINSFVAFISRGALLYNNMFRKIFEQIFLKLEVQHFALSREMEFNADQIATQIVGKEIMKRHTIRINYYTDFQKYITNFYINKKDEFFYTLNFYQNLNQLAKLYAERNGIAFKNDLPQPTYEQLNKNFSKLEIENIYSTHPELKDTLENIDKSSIHSDEDNSKISTSLIHDIEKYEENFTFDYFFSLDIIRKNELSNDEFLTQYSLFENTYNYPNEYHKLFNEKRIEYKEILEFDANKENQIIVPEMIFNKENTEIYEQIFVLKNDINVLYQLNEYKKIKVYKYDNVKYQLKDTENLIEKLTKEHENRLENITKIHQKELAFFAQNLTLETRHLAEKGLEYQELLEKIEQLAFDIRTNSEFMTKLTHEKLIREGINYLKDKNKELKTILAELLKNEKIINTISPIDLNSYQNYLNDEQIFYLEQYLEREINDFFEVLNFIEISIQQLQFSINNDFLISFINKFESKEIQQVS